MTIYKRKNKITGEFSTGGVWPMWHKTGKIYKSESAAISTIRRTRKTDWNIKSKSFYKRNITEIVEFSLVETGKITII